LANREKSALLERIEAAAQIRGHANQKKECFIKKKSEKWNNKMGYYEKAFCFWVKVL